MNGIYLLLGSNLGDRLDNLRTATKLLQQEQIKVLNESSIYETEPWGPKDQPWFLNIILQIESTFSPEELLAICLETEKYMGRIREEKWGPRLIDIDILYFNDTALETGDLQIPHPGIPDRKFTLIPMCELSPDEIHPINKQTQLEMLSKCTDELDCRQTEFHL